jgi:hypothetical protein
MKRYFSQHQKFDIDYFRSLVAVALADGVLKTEEVDFFHRRTHELGFPYDTVEKMISADKLIIDSPLSESIDEIDFLTDIVAMAMIDGELHEKEYQLCIQLSAKKGHSKEDVDQTITWLNELIKSM